MLTARFKDILTGFVPSDGAHAKTSNKLMREAKAQKANASHNVIENGRYVTYIMQMAQNGRVPQKYNQAASTSSVLIIRLEK
jgi:hypothetical protein